MQGHLQKLSSFPAKRCELDWDSIDLVTALFVLQYPPKSQS
jgi:hypothetical protein